MKTNLFGTPKVGKFFSKLYLFLVAASLLTLIVAASLHSSGLSMAVVATVLSIIGFTFVEIGRR